MVAGVCFFGKTISAETDQSVHDGPIYCSYMAICLELTAMAGACEADEISRDFLLSSYTSPLCLDVIRRNDTKRAKEVFKAYRPHWTDEQFAAAEILVSGVEYATLVSAGEPVPFEMKISNALHNILGIYGIPEEIREMKINKVFAKDYRKIGLKALADFKLYVAEANDEAILNLLKR